MRQLLRKKAKAYAAGCRGGGGGRGTSTSAAKIKMLCSIAGLVCLVCLYGTARRVVGMMKARSRQRTRAAAVEEALGMPASDARELARELRDLEERLATEIMANEIESTFTCEGVKAQVLKPLYGTRHATAPWYNFRTRQYNRHAPMLPYSGLRIYPEPRLSRRSTVASKQRLTIVVHLAIDHLILLRTLIGRLDDRTTGVSASVFVPHHLKTAFWSNHRNAREEVYEEIGCQEKARGRSAREADGAGGGGGGEEEDRCPFIDIHIVYADTIDRSHGWCTGATPDACLYYPVQQLRNIAMSFVRTQYVVSIDVNFMPSSHGLFARALREMRTYDEEKGGADPKRVWVVNLRDSTCDASGTFDGCTPGGMLLPDHPSHAPSYKTPVPWQDSTEPQPVEYQFAYEPFFIGETEELPLYDERFWCE